MFALQHKQKGGGVGGPSLPEACLVLNFVAEVFNSTCWWMEALVSRGREIRAGRAWWLEAQTGAQIPALLPRSHTALAEPLHYSEPP